MIQQAALTSFAPAHFGAFTLVGSAQSAVGPFGAGFLSAVLPTNQTPAVVSAPGQNAFAASYAPQIYAVYLNGLVANAGVSAAALETNTIQTDIAKPPILGDPPGPIPGLPPIQPATAPEGAQQVIAALTPLAGGTAIFSGAPAQTGAASTGGSQSSASRSTAHAAKK